MPTEPEPPYAAERNATRHCRAPPDTLRAPYVCRCLTDVPAPARKQIYKCRRHCFTTRLSIPKVPRCGNFFCRRRRCRGASGCRSRFLDKGFGLIDDFAEYITHCVPQTGYGSCEWKHSRGSSAANVSSICSCATTTSACSGAKYGQSAVARDASPMTSAMNE